MHDWLVVLGDEICCVRQHELQNAFATGVLPELDALASLLGANEEWEQDASAVRARMLNILLDIADRYQAFGAQPITQIPSVKLNSLISCSKVSSVRSTTLLLHNCVLHSISCVSIFL